MYIEGVDFIRNKKYYLSMLLVILLIYTLIGNYEKIKEEILQSSIMWCTVLLPSLFPYLVLSQFISSSKMMNYVAGFFEKPLKNLIRTNSSGINVFLCSLICGYPSGAVCTADLYRNSLLSKSEVQRIICFTNNAGPLFLISAIGTGMLGNTADGIAIYIIQIFSCICYAFFTGTKSDTNTNNFHTITSMSESKDFCQCVKIAVTTIVNIGGFIIITSVICKIIIILISGILPNLTDFQLFVIETGVYSLFEISRASGMIAYLPKSPLSFAILCAAVSWSGISVFLQVKSALPSEIKIRKFVFSKSIQALISFISGYIYKTFQPVRYSYSEYNFIFISFISSILLFFLFVIVKRSKKLR